LQLGGTLLYQLYARVHKKVTEAFKYSPSVTITAEGWSETQVHRSLANLNLIYVAMKLIFVALLVTHLN
jgi:hypothetical protein